MGDVDIPCQTRRLAAIGALGLLDISHYVLPMHKFGLQKRQMALLMTGWKAFRPMDLRSRTSHFTQLATDSTLSAPRN
jgi:hypothetical protein